MAIDDTKILSEGRASIPAQSLIPIDVTVTVTVTAGAISTDSDTFIRSAGFTTPYFESFPKVGLANHPQFFTIRDTESFAVDTDQVATGNSDIEMRDLLPVSLY